MALRVDTSLVRVEERSDIAERDAFSLSGFLRNLQVKPI
jgi:hypothetical protein